MIPKSSYKRKLFLYFLTVFVVFTTVISAIQYNREKQNKVRELKAILNTYSDFVDSYILHNNIASKENYALLDSIKNILPREDIRITVIGLNGVVLYDSFFKNYSEMRNHIGRPEIHQAIFTNVGQDIRVSESTNQPFYYYAKKYDNYFLRSAVLYSLSIKEFLRVDNIFWLLIAILFLLITSILLFVSDTMGKSILKLKDFATKAARNDNIDTPIDFPENELGDIGNEIVKIYNKLSYANKRLNEEKEKLTNHIQVSKEGVAIFSKSDDKILANSIFIQNLNLISDGSISLAEDALSIEELKPIKEFVRGYLGNCNKCSTKTLPVKRVTLSKNMRQFEVQCIIFHDCSYEISINDVTQQVKQKKLKQEMTSNIAHELRTPVSSIKGYLETVLTNNNIATEKQQYFIEKAALQTERLSDLIRDISELTKIEEASDLYPEEVVNLSEVVNDVVENLHSLITSNNAKVVTNLNSTTKVIGNKALIFSIFQNLIDNSLNYAGENITIKIEECGDENNKVNISLSDNGVGIKEEHLTRIFERFYRVDQGRSRDSGGTGLGLAIVKNAVELYGNKISVRNKTEGGAEFLFSLNKTKEQNNQIG